MKFETKAFDEIPVEIQNLAKDHLFVEEEVFEVFVVCYPGGTNYTVRAADDVNFVEIKITSGHVSSVGRVSIWTALNGIEKVPHITEKFKKCSPLMGRS